MTLAYPDITPTQANAAALRRRLRNPPNAKPDYGINIKNGKPVEVEKQPAKVESQPTWTPAVRINRSPSSYLSDDEYVAEFFRPERETTTQRITVEAIQKAVARRFGVTRWEMLSERRAKRIAIPRHVAVYLARRLTQFSYPKIARLFGNRDHTSLINSVNRTEELMEKSEQFAAIVMEIKGRFSDDP